MKKFWKTLLLIVGGIGAIFLFFVSPAASRSKFKKLVRKKDEEIDEVKEKVEKVKEEKKETKAKIKSQDKKIKKTKTKVKSTKSAKKTIDDFEKKYRNKK